MSGVSKLWKTPGKIKARRREQAALEEGGSERYTGIDPGANPQQGMLSKAKAAAQARARLGSVKTPLSP